MTRRESESIPARVTTTTVNPPNSTPPTSASTHNVRMPEVGRVVQFNNFSRLSPFPYVEKRSLEDGNTTRVEYFDPGPATVPAGGTAPLAQSVLERRHT